MVIHFLKGGRGESWLSIGNLERNVNNYKRKLNNYRNMIINNKS